MRHVIGDECLDFNCQAIQMVAQAQAVVANHPKAIGVFLAWMAGRNDLQVAPDVSVERFCLANRHVFKKPLFVSVNEVWSVNRKMPGVFSVKAYSGASYCMNATVFEKPCKVNDTQFVFLFLIISPLEKLYDPVEFPRI